MADIPGLIEGASEGAGLGIRFLKHLTRNRILLHLVDMAPFDGSDPAQDALSIARELEAFSPTLAGRERWLVLNKLDLIDESERDQRCDEVISELQWTEPVFRISFISIQENAQPQAPHHDLIIMIHHDFYIMISSSSSSSSGLLITKVSYLTSARLEEHCEH